ncbi:hypothetical protein EDB19DRAFT_1920178 [Suillus lakei]|nr:hypothetical protein EDB19DRAFT_1920178 [Suillus lakei]
MAHIASDPALDIAPDFASATFQGIRLHIIGNMQATHEEVANKLIMGWQQDRDIWLTAWNLQVNKEARLAAEAAQAEQEWLLLEQEAENERHEVEKKKPKINDFKAGASVSDTLTHCPSQYAIHKLKSYEYVELWYFSPDGCREAANEAKSSADGTFGFTKVDDFVALKTIASFRPSCKVIQDHGIEWCQFDMAKNSFLIYINKLNWPEKHQRAVGNILAAALQRPILWSMLKAQLFGHQYSHSQSSLMKPAQTRRFPALSEPWTSQRSSEMHRTRSHTFRNPSILCPVHSIRPHRCVVAYFPSLMQ